MQSVEDPLTENQKKNEKLDIDPKKAKEKPKKDEKKDKEKADNSSQKSKSSSSSSSSSSTSSSSSSSKQNSSSGARSTSSNSRQNSNPILTSLASPPVTIPSNLTSGPSSSPTSSSTSSSSTPTLTPTSSPSSSSSSSSSRSTGSSTRKSALKVSSDAGPTNKNKRLSVSLAVPDEIKQKTPSSSRRKKKIVEGKTSIKITDGTKTTEINLEKTDDEEGDVERQSQELLPSLSSTQSNQSSSSKSSKRDSKSGSGTSKSGSSTSSQDSKKDSSKASSSEDSKSQKKRSHGKKSGTQLSEGITGDDGGSRDEEGKTRTSDLRSLKATTFSKEEDEAAEKQKKAKKITEGRTGTEVTDPITVGKFDEDDEDEEKDDKKEDQDEDEDEEDVPIKPFGRVINVDGSALSTSPTSDSVLLKYKKSLPASQLSQTEDESDSDDDAEEQEKKPLKSILKKGGESSENTAHKTMNFASDVPFETSIKEKNQKKKIIEGRGGIKIKTEEGNIEELKTLPTTPTAPSSSDLLANEQESDDQDETSSLEEKKPLKSILKKGGESSEKKKSAKLFLDEDEDEDEDKKIDSKPRRRIVEGKSGVKLVEMSESKSRGSPKAVGVVGESSEDTSSSTPVSDFKPKPTQPGESEPPVVLKSILKKGNEKKKTKSAKIVMDDTPGVVESSEKVEEQKDSKFKKVVESRTGIKMKADGPPQPILDPPHHDHNQSDESDDEYYSRPPPPTVPNPRHVIKKQPLGTTGTSTTQPTAPPTSAPPPTPTSGSSNVIFGASASPGTPTSNSASSTPHGSLSHKTGADPALQVLKEISQMRDMTEEEKREKCIIS